MSQTTLLDNHPQEDLLIAENYPNGSDSHGFLSGEETVSEDGKFVTEEEYWERYYEHPDISYEWNNGILEEKPLPDYRRITMYGWFLTLLRAYLEVNPIAKMLFLEMGFRLPMGKKTSIRKPDLFVIRDDNPIPLRETDRSYRGTSDLCVESLSDSTKKEMERDTIVKKGEYALVGVKEYYILDVDEQMAFYRRTAAGTYARIKPDADGVIHSEVLPGFHFRISDLFRMPSLETMANDPLYQSFVLVHYQAEIQRSIAAAMRADVAEVRAESAEVRAESAEVRAESAEVRAESAEVRAESAEVRASDAEQRAAQAELQAEQERQRAERLAIRLRALGINED